MAAHRAQEQSSGLPTSAHAPSAVGTGYVLGGPSETVSARAS